MKTMGKFSLEILTHFNCGFCNRWWSIGDCDSTREEWYCPWCGKKQCCKEISDSEKNTGSSSQSSD